MTTKRARARTPLAVVHETLEGYARRGVFGAFHQDGPRFRFTWLWHLPFRLHFDARRHAIAFPALFPKSASIATELRRFVRGCGSKERVEHRRIDPSRLKVSWVRSRGAMSLVCTVQDGDYESGVKKAINLVSEIFLSFLNAEHPQYLVEQFQRPED